MRGDARGDGAGWPAPAAGWLMWGQETWGADAGAAAGGAPHPILTSGGHLGGAGPPQPLRGNRGTGPWWSRAPSPHLTLPLAQAPSADARGGRLSGTPGSPGCSSAFGTQDHAQHPRASSQHHGHVAELGLSIARGSMALRQRPSKGPVPRGGHQPGQKSARGGGAGMVLPGQRGRGLLRRGDGGGTTQGHRGVGRDSTEPRRAAPYLSPEQAAGTALFWAEVKD